MNLFFFFFLISFTSYAQQVSDRIKVNQLGYYVNAPKIAVVTGNTDAKTFYITSTNIRDTLFTGKLGEEKQSANSSTKTKMADFSALQKKGTFLCLFPASVILMFLMLITMLTTQPPSPP